MSTVLMLSLAAVVTAQEPTAATIPSISTNGEAVIYRAPDQAFVTAAVETRARSPRDAQQQNAAGMTAVRQRLAAVGVPQDAIRTLGYTVQQESDVVNGRRVPKDFVARNAVEVRVDAVDRTGEIVDALVQSGVTSVDNVRFDVKDRANLEREALRLAVVDARARADAAAAGAGQTVDHILRITDMRQPDHRDAMFVGGTRASLATVATTPVDPGSVEIRASVGLSVAIK